jgi:hypothetical protein
MWGFLENGIGLFVGNLSTLRPLFRRALGLGGNDDSTAQADKSKQMNKSAFPSQSRRTYKSFDTSYELGTVNTEKDASAHSTQIRSVNTNKALPYSPTTAASDTDSQSDILVQVPARSHGKNEIMVSRHINVSRH